MRFPYMRFCFEWLHAKGHFTETDDLYNTPSFIHVNIPTLGNTQVRMFAVPDSVPTSCINTREARWLN